LPYVVDVAIKQDREKIFDAWALQQSNW